MSVGRAEFCGSPGFMAPEMVIERQYDGKKADLWSIGCILLELLLTAKEFSTIWMKNFQVRRKAGRTGQDLGSDPQHRHCFFGGSAPPARP